MAYLITFILEGNKMKAYEELTHRGKMRRIRRIAREALDAYGFTGARLRLIVDAGNIISKSGDLLGEYDFFFEWFTVPTQGQINDLIEVIDERLAPLGCKYTLTTKS